MRRLPAVVLAAALLMPLPASAHVRSTEPQAPAGSRYTFSFLVEHGCEESPTIALRILLPEGAFEARPIDKPGWTAAVTGEPPVVEFSGGPLPDGVKEQFSVELVTPNRPGEEVLFRTVQRCEVGEYPWIALEANAEHPAPRVRLTANATPLTAPPPTTTTTVPPTTTTTTAAATTSSEVARGEAASDVDDGGGTIPLVPALLAVGGVATGAVLLLRRRRRNA